MEASIPQKKCSRCKQEFPATNEYFHKNAKAKFGLGSLCKPCAVQKSREWYLAHPDRVRQLLRESAARRRERDPQAVNKIVNEYSKAHRASINKSVRERHKKNPLPGHIKNHKRLALLKKAEGNFTAADIQAIHEKQEGLCAYCGIRLFNDYGIDHVNPLSRGGSNWPDNLALACHSCNSSKGNRLIHEWMETRCW